jgi:hypothetical protein
VQPDLDVVQQRVVAYVGIRRTYVMHLQRIQYVCVQAADVVVSLSAL